MNRHSGLLARVARVALYLCVLIPLLVFASGSADHEARVLWVNADRSVFKISPVNGTPELELASLPDVQALAVEETDDHVWVYSHKHLWAYDAQGNVLISADMPRDFHGGEPAGMVADGEAGNLWIGLHRKLYRFDLNGALQVTLDLDHDIEGLTLDTTRSHLWVAECDRLLVLDKTGATLFTVPLDRPADVLAYDTNLDEVWVVSGRNVSRYDASGNQTFSGKVQGDINDHIAPDGQGGLWAAGDRTLSYLNQSGSIAFTLTPFATDPDQDGDADHVHRIIDLVADPLNHTTWVADGRYLEQYATDGTLKQTVDVQSFTGSSPCADDDGVDQPRGMGRGERAWNPDCEHDGRWSDFWHGRRGIHHVALYVDTIPPTVSITSPANGLYTNHPQLPLVLVYSDVGSGVDPSTIKVTNDGVSIPVNCQPNADSTGATCTPVSRLPDGKYDLEVTVADYAGNVSKPASVYFTVDTVPPTITLNSPAGQYTNQPNFTIAGSLSEAGTLTINGASIALGPTFAFSGTVQLTEGNNTLTFVATDLAGNVTTLIKTLNLNTVPPVQANNTLIGVTGPVNGVVTITGKAGSVAPNVSVTITDTKTGQSVSVTSGSAGAFTATLAAGSNDSLQISEKDLWGNVTTDPNPIAVSNLPPDPASVATPLSTTGLTTFSDSTAFLYSGAEPIQTGVAPGTIVAQRAAVIRGKVLDSDGNPLPGVTIFIQGHSELGQTLSRADGMFDLAVNGGGLLTVEYSKQGYISSQREVQPPWQNYVIAPDVVLIQPDSKVTSVSFGANAPLQVAKGSVATDSDGSRQATVLFPAGTIATMVMPDGSSQPLTSAQVRATEFTVGPTGPEAMPAELPPASAYTYAVDLSMDQAEAAGAASVQFNQPVMVYVNNFLGLPAGSVVPSGYYDPAKSAWIPSQDGLVIKILDINAQGLADLDVDGSGNPATAAQLASLGITDAERAQLAASYTAGTSLWRVPLMHFTEWDFNLGYSSTVNLILPPDQAKNKNTNPPDTKDSNICTGCQINAQGQVLGENIPIAGTDFSLHYSSQTPLSISRHSENIVITTSTVPAGLKRIELDIDIAGQHFTEIFGTAPNQNYTFTWNGLDAYGRTLSGSVTATFQLAYVYQVPYDVFLENYHGPWFGRTPPPGQTMAGYAHNGRNEVAATRQWTDTFWSYSPNTLGIDRWSLSVHDYFDPHNGTLYEGNGTVRSGLSIGAIATSVAGNGNPGVSGDGGPAKQALVWDPSDVKVAPDGSIYFSMVTCVRKITPDGIIHTYAGVCDNAGAPAPTITPVLATSVYIDPERIALGKDGSLYIQTQNQILRVTPDQMIYVVAGAGGGPPEPVGRPIDGEPAQQATFVEINAFTVGNDGSIYLSDGYENGGMDIWQVTPDGILHVLDTGGCAEGMTIAPDGDLVIGTCGYGFDVLELQPDGQFKKIAGGGAIWPSQNPLAINANLLTSYDNIALTYGPDGSLYIESGNSCCALPSIERVDPTTGIITEITGTDPQWGKEYLNNYPGDGVPAAQIEVGANGIAVDSEGRVYIPAFYWYRLVMVEPVFAGDTLGNTTITSSDGTRLYQFDPSGRHLRTVDARTGKNIYTFQYDSAGQLTGIVDAEGRETVIERNSAGTPTAIVSPDGQTTSLTVDSNGFLTAVSDPASDTWRMAYAPSGLLTTFTDPNGHSDQYTYDANGLLTQEVNAAGGGWTLSRTDATDGSGTYTVAMTSGAGHTSTFEVQPLLNGDRKQVNTLPDGTVQTSTFSQGGSNTVTNPDGTVLITQLGPDPRLGIQAPVMQNETIKLPSGLTATLAETRMAPLTDLSNPLFGYSQLTDALNVNGQTWNSVFDLSSMTTTLTSPMGRKTVIVSDSLDRPVSAQLGNLAPVSYAYDSAGHLTNLTAGTGISARVTQYSYYASGPSKGYLQSVTDPLNRTVSYQYDAAGRPTLEILPDGEQIAFGYDANGNLTSLTPPGRPAHDFAYTPVNDVATYTPPAVSGVTDTATHYSYNLDRQLTGITLPDGEGVSLGYDFGGQLSTVTLPTGSYQYGHTTSTGQLATLSAPDGENLAYTWDGFLNTGTKWSGTVAGSVTRTYDGNFRVTALDVDGSSTTYGYDNDGLLTAAGGETLTRDPGDGLITGSTLDGVTTAMTYDSFGEPQTKTVTDGATSLYSVSYTRDNLGRITQKTETVNGTTNTWIYGYDQNGRLDAVTENGNPVASYGYDQNGNRVSVNAAMIATYDNQDRMLTHGNASYTYNANGERTSITTPNGTTSYTYDALGNLLEVKLSSGEAIQYLYDGQNRLVGKEVNGKLTEGFLYDGQLEPVAELDGSGNIVEQFVYGTRPNVPDYIIKGGVEYRVISDQVGSPVLIVNASTGAIAEQISYDAWGNITSDSNPGFQPFGFAGGLYDADMGLVHFGARDYDPQTGRWISKDPILFAGGDSNLYGYVLNDPINMLDGSGLQSFGAFLPYGYSQQDVNTAVAMRQARETGLQMEAQRGANFEQAYSCNFESNQVLPWLQRFDPARSVGEFTLSTTSEAGLWELETYGELQAEQGAAWGSGLSSAAGFASYALGPGEAAAFGLDTGDAILSSYQAANESGFNASMAVDLVHGGQ